MENIFYKFTSKEDGNLAFHVPDKKENVDKNRLRLSKRYGFNIEKLIYMEQVHGNNVVLVDKNSPALIKNCDGLITREKDLILMVMVADCIPIIFIDKIEGVVAAVHAGRNSTFLKIAEITAKKMMDELNCKPENIEVILGPSIQKCCYEVNEEMANIVKNSFGKNFVNGRYIDLQNINKNQLNQLGITNITISNTCTKCSKEPYYSYRVDNQCGRFAGIVSILG